MKKYQFNSIDNDVPSHGRKLRACGLIAMCFALAMPMTMTSCHNNTQTGALIGGLGGAAVGGATHGKKGALIGGAAGAAGGALIGNHADRRH